VINFEAFTPELLFSNDWIQQKGERQRGGGWRTREKAKREERRYQRLKDAEIGKLRRKGGGVQWSERKSACTDHTVTK
jgi:hypothetical protein